MSRNEDITRVINITKEDFTVEWGGEPFTIKAGKDKMLVNYVAKHFAKHLIDKIYQKPIVLDGASSVGLKKKMSHSWQDSPLRKSLMSKILPDLAEEAGVKTMTPEEEKEAILEQIKKANDIAEEASGASEDMKESMKAQNVEIEKLKKEIEEMKKLNEKKKNSN